MLSWSGWQLELRSPDADESMKSDETPEEYTRRLAMYKSYAQIHAAGPGDFIIAADTIVVLNGQILAKPENPQRAFEMLSDLRDRDHHVLTAVAIRQARDNFPRMDICCSDVYMRDYSNDEIRAYIESGDPLDKAGAYAIQNREFDPVAGFAGCVASVMGLPLCHMERTLRSFLDYEATDWPKICQKKLEYTCPITKRVMSGEDIG